MSLEVNVVRLGEEVVLHLTRDKRSVMLTLEEVVLLRDNIDEIEKEMLLRDKIEKIEKMLRRKRCERRIK